MTAKTSPVLTLSPTLTRISWSLPSAVAVMSFCIFMASNTRRTSPRLTAVSASTLSAEILPGIGALTVMAPSGIGPPTAGAGDCTGAAGVGAGVGAGAAGAGAAGAGATGAAGVAPPTSSTSTSYDLPLTVILNFFHIRILLDSKTFSLTFHTTQAAAIAQFSRWRLYPRCESRIERIAAGEYP